MKAFKDYDTTTTIGEMPKLPAGAYECEIIAAKVAAYTGKDGTVYEKLEIAFDIVAGEFAGYFRRQYDALTDEYKKWKGVLRLSVPTDDGSDGDNWAKRILKTCIEAVEDSNSGYHWDWDEKKLKGKSVGCLFRNEEWEYKGKTGWKAMPFRFLPIEAVRDGKFTIPNDKPLNKPSAPVTVDSIAAAAVEDADDDLPFAWG